MHVNLKVVVTLLNREYFGENRSFQLTKVELVSKELNHFGAIASFSLDWAPGTLTGGA